jgi:site-specific DNA-methyltransferase (cytosine-N4-specific)
MSTVQLTLFDVHSGYDAFGEQPVSNDALYSSLARRLGVPRHIFDDRVPVGKSEEPHSAIKRQVRWFQQTLKQAGVLERVARGVWRLVVPDKNGLHAAPANLKVVAFSTSLGVALWADCRIFRDIHEPIHLCLTSPPYPLKKPRNYGNTTEAAWVDFLCESLEPIVKNLVRGGSIVLNISNDIFEHKSPARSLYLERTILALHDRLGLHLMDRIPWVNRSKPPAPTYWACVQRFQLAVAWEPILWFTNDPLAVRSDNRRVLEPHTDKHKAFMKNGGDKRTVAFGDGAYKLRPGSFGRETPGRIPKNIVEVGHACSDTNAVRRAAKSLGQSAHGAMFPTRLCDFFVRFLTEKNDLVVDPFGGSQKVALSAERHNRRWVTTERMYEYLQQAQALFKGLGEEQGHAGCT